MLALLWTAGLKDLRRNEGLAYAGRTTTISYVKEKGSMACNERKGLYCASAIGDMEYGWLWGILST